MQANFLILLPIIFGVIAGDYVGPQNGFRNGNGNGNAYGVPPDSITPPQPQGGPYPPSGWKPAGRRLLLPGESRSAQQPIDSGFGQPPSQYGPVNPAPSGPSIDNQYGPSVDNTGPNNQYIPGTGFGNGNGNGNGHGNGNGNGNGNGHGNGHNGNGNGHNGNGNGHNGNGNGHNGNGNGHNGNGNGHNGNGNGHNGNGNGHNGNGNGHNGNGNGHNGNGNGHNGNGNGHNGNGGNGNGFSNGNGGFTGNGATGNGGNGFAPGFHGAFPGGLIYPFIQHSIPAVLAYRPSNGGGQGSIYPLYQVSTAPSQTGTGVIASSFPTGQGVFPITGANPSFQIPQGTPDIGAIYPTFQLTGAHDVVGSHPAVVGQGNGLIGHGIGQYYTLLSNHQSPKSNILGVKNGLINHQLQYAVGNVGFGNGGVPLGVF